MKNFTLFLTTFLMTLLSIHAWSLEIPPKALERTSLEEQPNLVINGDFSNELTSWTSFIADFAGVSASVAVSNGEAAITNIAGAGGEVWFVQLNQELTPTQIGALEVGQTYKVSFQARSTTAGRQLRMYFGENGGGFQSINVTDVTLGTEMQTFEATFTVGATFEAMKLGFEMGLSNDPVFIDNVSLVKTEASDEPTEPETGGGLSLPVTFDDEDIDYVLADFGGAVSEIVTDPTDPINNVVQTIKSADAADFAGTTVGGPAGFSSPIPFAPGATTMSVRVWSPVSGIPVRLKVEDSRDNTISVETEARVTQAETWQTLVFDFSNEAFGTAAINFANSYNMASIFFDFGTSGESVGAARTYFWDDMEFGGEVGEDSGLILLPITFENDIDWSAIIENFAGGELTVIDNPDTEGNESARVGRMVKNAGEVFGGSVIRLDQTIDLSRGTEFRASVWAPRAGSRMLLKFENPLNPAQEFEQNVEIPVANEWVDISFDMSGANRAFTFRNIVLIFDLGTVGDGSENFTWFVDNIRQVEEEVVAPADRPTLPLTFEEDINWEAVITNFDGGVLTVIDNPDTNGNSSAKVARMVKNPGQPWGGAFIDLAGPIDLSQGTEFTAQVWAPRENTTMLFKFENSADPGQNFEQNVTIPASNEWTDVSINMSGANRAFPYDRIVFIFDLGTVGDGSGNFTWFLDNVAQVQGEGPGVGVLTLPVTFEDEDIDYELTDFEGTSSEIVVDPTNPANRVAQTTKSETAALFAGTTIGGTAGFASPIPFAAGATFMNVRVWSPVAGIQVRLKVEASNDPTISVETEATVTEASGWQTITFNFANQAAGTEAINFARSYNKATIFFDFGRSGADVGEARTYFWDDLAFGQGQDQEEPQEPGEQTNLVINGDFADGLNSWTPFIADFAGVSANVAVTNGEAAITGITGAGGEIWHVQLNQIFTPEQIALLEIGETYNVSFQARSTVENRQLRMYFGEDGGGFRSIEVTDVTLGTEMQTFEVTFEVGAIYDAMKLGFEMGLSNDPVFIGNVSMVKEEGETTEPETPTSLVINGDFADGLNSWTPFIADFAGVSANVAVTNGEAAITDITGAGGEIWHVQLNQIFTPEQIALLEVGETYNVSFQARSTVENRQLRMYFGEDGGGFRSIEVTDVTLGTEMQTFEVSFEVGATYDAMKLGFEMGLSNDPVFIDNVSMVKEVFELRGQTITFVDIPAQLAGADPIELEATASSGLAVSFTAESENISIEGNMVTLLAPGRATIVATQEGNNEFRPAPPVTRTFCINPLRPTITLSGEGTGNTVLTSNASTGNQWFRNGIAIEGATGQTFTVTNQGSYTVSVRVDDCVSEASEAINLIVNSNRIQRPREISVFPNPVETYLQIRGISESVSSVEMVDMTGRVNNIVFEQSNDGIRANVANLAPGMYVVRIQEGNRSYAVKVLKK
ncbi:carbohydrate binding domain-containing protein [Mongoliitalea lutea]|nr:carbohydrate binding domain-containing protein [Mongoliitalea lutea]